MEERKRNRGAGGDEEEEELRRRRGGDEKEEEVWRRQGRRCGGEGGVEEMWRRRLGPRTRVLCETCGFKGDGAYGFHDNHLSRGWVTLLCHTSNTRQ